MRQYMAHTWPRAQNEFFVPCAIFSGRRYTCPACTTCCRADTQNLRSLRRSPQIADAGALTNHRQAAHPNSSSKAHAILLTKRIMHVKLVAYILNSVWFHYVSAHSSSSHSPLSCSFSSSLSLASASAPCYSSNFASPSYPSIHALSSAVDWNLLLA